MVAGTRLSHHRDAVSHENDRRYDPVTFTSSNPKVAQVSPDGRVVAVAPGSATLMAKAAGATQAIAVQVLAGPVTEVTLTPDRRSVLAGDVVRFKADVRGRVARLATWRCAGPSRPVGREASASFDGDGAFVAESPGKYTVTASAGGATADAVVEVAKRRVGRGFQVVARAGEVLHRRSVGSPVETCVYLSTIADRVYAIDVTRRPRRRSSTR